MRKSGKWVGQIQSTEAVCQFKPVPGLEGRVQRAECRVEKFTEVLEPHFNFLLVVTISYSACLFGALVNSLLS